MSEAVAGGGSSDGISRELKDRFHEAIEEAVNPGGQKYALNGVPQCVIGCYAAKYAPEAFKRAAGIEAGIEAGNLGPVEFPSYSVTYMVEAGVELVPKEVMGLAQEIQATWDSGVAEDNARVYLHFVVEAA